MIHYQDESVTIHHGDCLEVLELPDNSVHAVVTDPPYGLEFMGKDWDAPWKAAGKVAPIRGESTDKSHPFRNGGNRVVTDTYKPAKNDDVWVDFEGNEWPGVVEKREPSGYIRCRIQVDPEWDFGRGGARVMPEQTVAVRSTHVRPRSEVSGA